MRYVIPRLRQVNFVADNKDTDETDELHIGMLCHFLNNKSFAGRWELAKQILDTLGGIKNFSPENLEKVKDLPGLSEIAFRRLQAVYSVSVEIAKEHAFSEDVINSPSALRDYLRLMLQSREAEVFAVLFLDNRHRPIAFEELFIGTLDSAAVYPREVVKRVLDHNAAAVVLVHNHPSGTPTPSDTDVRLTRKLTDALALIDCRTLDHVVVATGGTASLAERGLM